MDNACRSWVSSDWATSDWPDRREEWGAMLDVSSKAPSHSYSARSALLAKIRALNEWAKDHADEFIRAPSTDAMAGAKLFIQNLPEGCLECRMAFSQSGEINIFFGAEPELLQILIDDHGRVSFYGSYAGQEMSGADLLVAQFPFMDLLKFVGRNK